MISSFFWFALAGMIAYECRFELASSADADDDASDAHGESVWASRTAMAAVISLPIFAIYTMKYSNDAPAVRDFRLMATFAAAIPLAMLVFLRTHLADADRVRLLEEAKMSVNNLRKLQTQIVQSEKLASLGQLAAGAAHEINNPLTAILGFSDLLADDPSLSDKARSTAGKIRDQARRTKTLVGNLLSFARQVPVERTLLDVNTLVADAVRLRTLDLHGSPVKVEMHMESFLPGVRGDGNQLIQVFFNIISNAIDAMEAADGGVLNIKTTRERGSVVVLFTDSGPGIKEPDRVFDPFYTTKPVGKGTGLGLSICFGIMQEHGGKLSCYNGARGGAVFRVELTAVLAPLPTKEMPLATLAEKPTLTGKV
jgi:signal transduction histidine kinase